MFYVFYCNDGYMLALDIPPNGYFRELHQELTQKTGVSSRDQVFFLSSGEALVGDYSLTDYNDVGTESNPIYFIKRVSSEKDPLNSREEEGIRNLFDNWKRDVEQLHTQPPKLELVNRYCDAGTHGLEVAETLIRYCAKIVSEHQNLNQGWIAVTRNLDANVLNISTRYNRACKIVQQLSQIKGRARNWVANFDAVFDALSKIKVPNSLVTSQSGSSDSEPNAESPPEPITLLDWIEQQDPLHSLDNLIEHVEQHIEKVCFEVSVIHLDDHEVAQAAEALKTVKDLVKRKDYQEIKGIDKRLAMLDAKLVDLENVFSKLKESALKLINAQADSNNFRNVIGDQRDRIDKLAQFLEDFTRHAFLFLNSKLELLKNVRQRLSGWIRQSYDRLQCAQTNVMLFDEKFNGFRQRLDLVRQIREAPILFVATVAEVIRRNAFHAEFNEWLVEFIRRCSEFIKDENTTRAEFYCKLEKHFLRDIFKGLGDELPNFCPPKVKFDTKLPIVSDDLLRELRESLKDCAGMESHFTIVYPQIFNKLTVLPKASNQQPESREQQTFFHREESFFVRDKSINPMHSNFPSSNWLAGVTDENSEMSQSPITNQFFMSKTNGSNTSLHTESSSITTPSDLVSNLESIQPTSSIPRKLMSPSSVDLASPTSIHPEHFKTTSKNELDSVDPNEPPAVRPLFKAGDDSEITMPSDGTETGSSTTPIYTPVLSPTKIEESQQTCMLQDSSVTIRDNDFLKDIKPRLAEITEELKTLQTDASDHKLQIGQLFESNLNAVRDEATNKLKAAQISLDEQIQTNNQIEERLVENENKVSAFEKELEKLKAENAELKQIADHEKYLRVEKEKEVFTLTDSNNKLNDDLLNTIQVTQLLDKNQLQLEFLSSEAERKKLEEKMETESNTSFDCLSIELDIVGQILKRELQPDEIEWIRSEIEKRKMVKKHDLEASTHQEHGPASRVEYENVLRRKMNLLVQGMEEKKNEEIAKLREIIENEIKEEQSKYLRKLKERIGELEDKLHFYEHTGPSATTSSMSQTLPTDHGMLTSFTSAAMHESCQVVRDEEEKVIDAADEETKDESEQVEEKVEGIDEEDADLAIVTISRNSVGTQTKLRMRDLKMMVSLNDISEGWAVIIVYSELHNSYCVFSTNNSLYFVKQRSLRSIGIEQNSRPTKNTLIFARVAALELCETKKCPNRYKLPANTRFYRVDVAPMPLTGMLPACVQNIESESTKTV
ncbi:RB1-inducible coiled-coil protein 1 [Aphelenchoides bicaudatus]|nr:RB1-inducible coiled-coil protein 1 [Aphelenchoides bicaudatus]